MLKIFEPSNVLYVCTCGAERPITKIYFCRHCSSLRCGECVSHEVDSHYCQNCLEYMPSPEARLKKNKCSNCFDCPSCMHTLSTRATSIQIPNPEDASKTMPKKVYYLVCGFCRWTSRDVGIADQATASGGWQEAENPHSKRISQLMEYYRLLAQKEKLERERKKINQRYSYLHISDKYGMSATVVRKLAGLPPTLSKGEPEASEQLTLPEATSDVEPLPESYLTQPLNLSSVTTLKQRLFQPQFQPVYTSELYPQNKYMHIKRSQRCKVCEHNLSKPEYNPSSIKFKIQLAAFYHIPELRIKNVSKLYLQKTCLVEMVLINPTPHLAHITFEPVENPSDDLSSVKLPPGELILAPRDDTAEFDDVNDNQNFKDDPNIVTFRKANKLGFMFSLVPSTKDVVVSFKMKHDFINMVVTLPGEQPREPQVVWLTHTLKIRLGTVVGEV
ncbi:Dynactin subunit 4 like protein [Argiope bruennichi]|uniref:Dynactin subunit 4 n=1 Tax=Argiope bruennichi TaxID=94029 RepID=A0A8T0F9H3_ARGBR|nr:Dynactin subunit 4 like protein [Argiope bruennichi]